MSDRWGGLRNNFINGSSASELAQKRIDQQNDAIRAPGVLDKSDFWKPGEYGKACDMEREFCAKTASFAKEQENTIPSTIEAFLRTAYTPTADISDEAFCAVSRSLAKVYMIWAGYAYALPNKIRRTRDIVHQQMRYANLEQKQALQRDLDGYSKLQAREILPLLYPFLAKRGLRADWKELTTLAEGFGDGFDVKSVLQKLVKEDITRIDYMLPMAEAVKDANLTDRAFVRVYERVNLSYQKGETLDIEREINHLRTSDGSGNSISNSAAEILLAALSTPENIRQFICLCQDVEWSNDPQNLKMERQILQDLLDSPYATVALNNLIGQIIDRVIDRYCLLRAALRRMGNRHCIGYSMEDIAKGKHLGY